MAPEVNQHLLIAVDASENSRRSLQYVAGMLGGGAGWLYYVSCSDSNLKPHCLTEI